MANNALPKLIPCDYCPTDNSKCDNCNNSKIMRLEILNTNYGIIEMYVPSSISKQEAEETFNKDLDRLRNNMGLTD